MSTTAPIGDFCRRCYSVPCRCYSPPAPPPSPDWFLQSQVTGFLVDITKQLAELAEIVHGIAEKLAQTEASNQEKKSDA